MNAFYEHHKDSIRFGYRCFDRILLNGLIQPFQQPERVIGFFDTYRHLYPVTRDVLRGAADRFQVWVKEQADKWNAPIVEAPKGRRDEFVEPYFRGAYSDRVVVILKAREPARIMIAIGDKKTNRWHLQIADRWVVQYNFYVNDQHWGRMFVRMCPYLPFSARVCLNQHHWLANRLREEGIDFQQCSNAFLRCAAPDRLQELADTLTPQDLSRCGHKWLARFTPFFTETERYQAGCQHRLFFSQVELCDNLIFHRRTALDKLGERLLDANRTIGQPNKITVIFGRKVTKQYRGKLQTEIEDMDLPNPVIRSHYRNGFIKQYVRDHLILRTEPATNNVTDYGVNKAIDHLPALRDKMAAVVDNYLDVQQDILETFVDRGQLTNLAQPTVTATGKRIPGLKLDNPRQLALMHALVRFAQIPAASTFSTAEIYPHTVAALGTAAQRYTLASLRYDLSKLRVKGLVQKLPRSRRYRLRAEGYSICLIFLKLFERVYAPLSAARLDPVPGDATLPPRKHTLLDRLYGRLDAALDRLLAALGLALSHNINENKIPVGASITAYAFLQTALQKSGPCGAVCSKQDRACNLPSMDGLSTLYQDLLGGSYDCVDRIVLNAYFRMGHHPGGFRVWWRALTGSDQTLENTYLMRMAGRFSRRVRGYGKAHDIPVIDCPAGQRKHDLAEEYRAKTTVTQGLFLVLVGRAQAPVWDVNAKHHIERKKPMPYVNHYSFHILDREWGHLTIKISGHPPFPAQVMLNGHEYVACQARKAGLCFTKEGNCFTTISDAAGLVKIADTLSEPRAIGRLSQVCERWIYGCLCFALDFDEQKRSGFRYQYSSYQIEYSRNLIFQAGGYLDQVFQALIDRSRAPLDVKSIRTILGYRRRPRYRRRAKRSTEWEVSVERPVYDLTIFKLHCGKLTLKIYSKGERVLRIEAVAHNTQEFNCGRALDKFPEVVSRLRGVLERFANALSCIDQCFIADDMLEQLPAASQVGKTTVGGIDLNKTRMRAVVEAVIALSASPNGFTASDIAARVHDRCAPYRPRHAAYDLKKLRGKQIVRRIGHTRRYEPLPTGLRAMTALLVLRNKAIKPLLAAARPLHPARGTHNPKPIDAHYHTIQIAMAGVFHELGFAA